MPITKSAKKALRVSDRKRIFNLRRKNKLEGATKDLKKLIREKKTAEAKEALKIAYQAIDKAAKKGLIKKNTAARRKSRLSALVRKAA